MVAFCALGLAISAQNAWSEEIDCSRISIPLCNELKQATSNADTFSVQIGFFYPARDTACRGVDPHQDTSGVCKEKYDSAYFAGLKAQAETLFTKFELWDARHPETRLSAPSEGKVGIQGIVATKGTLIQVSQESYINSIEEWQEAEPLNIFDQGYQAQKKYEPKKYQVDGRAIPNSRRFERKIPFVSDHR
jgi:hypothetical protein